MSEVEGAGVASQHQSRSPEERGERGQVRSRDCAGCPPRRRLNGTGQMLLPRGDGDPDGQPRPDVQQAGDLGPPGGRVDLVSPGGAGMDQQVVPGGRRSGREELVRREIGRLRRQAERVEEREGSVDGMYPPQLDGPVDPEGAPGLPTVRVRRSDPQPGATEVGDQAGPVATHEIEDQIGREATQRGEKGHDLAERLPAERLEPPYAQPHNDQLQRAQAFENWPELPLHHPAEAGGGEVAAHCGEHGHSVDQVAECSRADDQDTSWSDHGAVR